MISISQARQVVRRSHAVRGRVAAAQRRLALRPRRRQRLGQDHVPARSSPATSRRPRAASPSRQRARVGVLRQDRFLDDERDHPRPRDDGRRRGVAARSQERARIVDHGEGDPEPARRARGHARAHDGYTLEARATAVLEGLGIPIASHRQPLVDAVGRLQAARAAGAGARRRPRRAAARRADQPPRHPLHPLAREVPRRLPRRARSSSRTTSASSTTSRRTSSTSTTGRSRSYTGNYSRVRCARRQAIARRARRPRSRAPRRSSRDKRAFVERFGAKATKAKQAQSRLKQIEQHRGRGARGELAARAAVPLRRPSGRAAATCSRSTRLSQGVRRQAGAARRVAHRAARREGRDHRAERPRQVDAAQDRHRPRSTPTPARCAGATRCASATSRRTTTRCSTTTSDDAARLPLGGLSRRGHRASCAGSSGACSSRATTSRRRSARSRAARRRA